MNSLFARVLLVITSTLCEESIDYYIPVSNKYKNLNAIK